MDLLGLLLRLRLIHRTSLFSFDEDFLDHGLLQDLLLAGQVLLIEVEADLVGLEQGLQVILNVEQHGHLLVLAQREGATRRLVLKLLHFEFEMERWLTEVIRYEVETQ